MFMPTTAMLDSSRGALYGLAIGDALGAAVEFCSPGSFPEVTGYRDGGPHMLEPGQWTDDTSMALALADSIGEKGWDLNDQVERYVQWRRKGAYSVNGFCFDIGNTTDSAINNFENSGNALTSGIADPKQAGNGSIMRLAPVVIHCINSINSNIYDLQYKAEGSSITTHAAPQCLSACCAMATLIQMLVELKDKATCLERWQEASEFSGPLDDEIKAVVAGSYKKEPPEIRGTGYVVDSLEAAMWAFNKADSFKEAVLLAVNLGDDADTTGAVCGQIAGAYWGFSGIDQELIDGLDKKEMIEKAYKSCSCQFLALPGAQNKV